MNKNGFIDLELDLNTIVYGAMGIGAGILSLYVMHASPANAFWKILTFIVSTVAGFFATKIIVEK